MICLLRQANHDDGSRRRVLEHSGLVKGLGIGESARASYHVNEVKGLVRVLFYIYR